MWKRYCRNNQGAPWLVALMLLGALLLTGCQGGAQAGDMYGPSLPPTATPARVIRSERDVPRISATDLWSMVQAGQRVVIVDTRSRQAYQQSHIRGAISLPAEELDARFSELASDAKVVFYCT